MSGDTVSPLFPDRPIRPLPKRRLRERLSPDVADSIQYPPAPQSTTPLFYYPYSPRDDEAESAPYGRRESRPGLQGPAGRNGAGTDNDDDASRKSRIANLAINMSDSMGGPTGVSTGQEKGKQPPQSAASSADGYYDPFEITNNKKKRKIPTAGESTLNGNHGGHDNIHAPDSPGGTPIQSIEGHGDVSASVSSPYYASAGLSSGSNNVSGPGRGRYGRVRNGRSPFPSLTPSDQAGAWPGLSRKPRSSQWITPSTATTGIIATAIANAEKNPLSLGQENLSLLQQQQPQTQATKAKPTATQFTFTCESQVPGSVAWPGADRRHTVAVPHAAVPTRDNGGRLSAPAAYPDTAMAGKSMAPQPPNNQSPAAPQPDAAAQAAPAPPPAPPAPPRKPTRREVNNELRQAAKDRRLDQLYANRHHPPADEDFWMCAFCEYEAIYNEPPRALIRQYELKDRRLRRAAAEKERLLKKASNMKKGRKGKKTKGKKNAASQTATTPQGEAGVPPPAPPTHDPGHEDEEYYDDGEEGYEDDERGEGSGQGLQGTWKDGEDGGTGAEGNRPLRPPTGQPDVGSDQASGGL